MSDNTTAAPVERLAICPMCGERLSHAGTLEFCPDEQGCGWARRVSVCEHESTEIVIGDVSFTGCLKCGRRMSDQAANYHRK